MKVKTKAGALAETTAKKTTPQVNKTGMASPVSQDGNLFSETGKPKGQNTEVKGVVDWGAGGELPYYLL